MALTSTSTLIFSATGNVPDCLIAELIRIFESDDRVLKIERIDQYYMLTVRRGQKNAVNEYLHGFFDGCRMACLHAADLF